MEVNRVLRREVKICFQITLNQKDKAGAPRLEKLQKFFEGGYITKQGLDSIQPRVQ